MINGQSSTISIFLATKYVFHKLELRTVQAAVLNAQWIFLSQNALPVTQQNIILRLVQAVF